jgi:hypothetical protein
MTDSAFAYADMPAALHSIARPFYSLFYLLHDKLPEGDAKVRAIVKLLEARCAALQAAGMPGGPVQKPPGGAV